MKIKKPVAEQQGFFVVFWLQGPPKGKAELSKAIPQGGRILTLFEQSGVGSLSVFIAARIFGGEFWVVKNDAATVGFTAKLTELNSQIRRIGVNYNQVVKELHVKFGEQKARMMLYKLEQVTIEIAQIGREVLQLCSEFKSKILGNNGS